MCAQQMRIINSSGKSTAFFAYMQIKSAVSVKKLHFLFIVLRKIFVATQRLVLLCNVYLHAKHKRRQAINAAGIKRALAQYTPSGNKRALAQYTPSGTTRALAQYTAAGNTREA